MAKNDNVKVSPMLVQVLALSDVFFDWTWNARKAVDEGDAKTDTTGFSGIVQNIAIEGQKQPIVVRPNPSFGKRGQPGASCRYSCVSGFTRGKAIGEIASGAHDTLLHAAAGMTHVAINKLHTDKPTILAFVRAMTEAEARKENLEENLQRSSLSAPDIAFGVARLREAMPTATDGEVAAIVGRSQQYVAKLKRIYDGLSGAMIPAGTLSKAQAKEVSVLEAWRTEPKKDGITNDFLESIARDEKMTARDKANAYIAKVNHKVDSEDDGPKKKKQGKGGVWVENAAIDAEAFGVRLGNLMRDDALSDDYSFDAKHCELIAPAYVKQLAGDKCTEDMRDAIVAACEKGIKKGLRPAAKVEVGQPTATKETPAKVAKAMQAKAVNGSARA